LKVTGVAQVLAYWGLLTAGALSKELIDRNLTEQLKIGVTRIARLLVRTLPQTPHNFHPAASSSFNVENSYINKRMRNNKFPHIKEQ
jgi:hypothetical protein